ncbi:ATP-binding cassette subfamily B protein [Chitinophaga polysaccharea]|uniref:ATP-binding cassette subfamily B protein n=1 Tax=Chitinophaga polysaccharea TaxID=1293035 RepID=A0A561PP75_9BACT|nr:peptidase domain-containing ABC transporter [Chitinophaga polysaccharea]TWF39910.1 ATP-binding cassette subfamily B protein [Chitinophaga polysaccharea]
MKLKAFPFYRQPDGKDCGPTCIKIISKHHGKLTDIADVRALAETTREGSSLLGLSTAAERLGFKTLAVKIDFNTLVEDVPLPCICHWGQQHFVVVYKITKSGGHTTIHVSDPAYGLIKYTRQEFIDGWMGKGKREQDEEGIALVMEPTPVFYETEAAAPRSRKDFSFLFTYFFRYKKLITQLIIGLLAGSLLSLIFPFLTQSIVDIGIQNHDLNFIYLVLLAQVMLFVGRMGIEVVRSWILLHLSSRINISIVSDFFIKLMKLPISYFDTRMTGDIMQRINDHQRIEQLLTNSSLNTLFSLFNLVIFSVVLLLYDYRLFLIYLFGAGLSVGWISFFLKKRKELDYKRFSQVAQEQSKVIELVNGMQEIKMHNAEKQMRWGWEFMQVKLFKIHVKALSLEQWQTVGGNFINQMKDIFVSFLAAKLVLDGQLTLGMMLAVQYIIGQLNGPLVQLMDFVKQTQDAKISLERLGEIHDKADEERADIPTAAEIPEQDIALHNVSFRYVGAGTPVFEQLSLTIPYRKTTAIVGASGSGKTTLLKLLMKFYEPGEGEIKIGNMPLQHVSPRYWRDQCGVVMQEGYVFNDTIARNIAIGIDDINRQQLKKAVDVACIRDFVESLPLNYNSKIGNEGIGISGGQKQRLFIARAVYKSPEYIFFDEATSALDANTERAIMGNLEQFLKGKTAVIIAHRLSTVKHADKIIVLDKGKVVEEGSHDELVALRKEYYRLVKNQLELGN